MSDELLTRLEASLVMLALLRAKGQEIVFDDLVKETKTSPRSVLMTLFWMRLEGVDVQYERQTRIVRLVRSKP